MLKYFWNWKHKIFECAFGVKYLIVKLFLVSAVDSFHSSIYVQIKFQRKIGLVAEIM